LGKRTARMVCIPIALGNHPYPLQGNLHLLVRTTNTCRYFSNSSKWWWVQVRTGPWVLVTDL